MTLQEELRMRAEQLNAVANAIAANDAIDPNGELSMRVRCAMRDMDRAARALDAAEKGLDRLLSIEAKLTMHESTTTAKWNEYVAAMSQARAALAEIRGEK